MALRARSSRAKQARALVALASLALLVLVVPAAASAALPKAGYLVQPHLAVRTKPAVKAPQIAVLDQFRPDHRPTVVHIVATVKTSAGSWHRVSLAGRPNGRYGWVRARYLEDVKPIRRLVRIDLSSRTLQVVDLAARRRLLFQTRVAVGARGMETPTGYFYLAAGFRPKSYLGPWAFETSAYSKLSEWPGGGIIGIHGWNDPSVMGRAVSHGCVRLTNPAILELQSLVPLGAALEIVQ